MGTGRVRDRPARLRPSPPVSSRLVLIGLIATACRVSFSPLQNRIEFGQEAFVVFAATGEGDLGDLYAVKPDGGEIWPVTYTRVDERLPGLSRDGLRLAFVRRSVARDAVVVMDLARGSEKTVLDPGADSVVALVWRADGALWVKGGTGGTGGTDETDETGGTGRERVWRVTEGEAATALDAADPAVDSGFAVLVGEPAFATVAPCDSGPGLCARAASGEQQVLDAGGSDPVRWGADSVGYFLDDRLYVRPLGPGRERFLRWHPEPVRPREPSYFPGP